MWAIIVGLVVWLAVAAFALSAGQAIFWLVYLSIVALILVPIWLWAVRAGRRARERNRDYVEELRRRHHE